MPDGAPAAGVPVVLTVERGVTESIFGVLAFGLSLGLAALPCLAPDAPRNVICGDDAQRAATGPDGGWAFRLSQAWVPGTLTDTKWHVTAAVDGPGGRAVSDVRFKVREQSPTAPDLQLWAPDVVMRDEGGRVAVSWPELPGRGFEDPPAYEVSWVDGAGRLVWAVSTERSDATIDARLREDTSGNLALVARASRWRVDIRYRYTHTAAARPYTGTAGAPLSRAKPCTVRDALGAESAPPGCPATDADLATPITGDGVRFPCMRLPAVPRGVSVPEIQLPSGVQACADAPPAVTVDLGQEVGVGLVVARGCDGCTVEASSDGTSWRALGRGQVVETPVAPTARWIRASGDGADRLAELSVWPGTPPAAPGPASTVAGAPPSPAAPDGDDDDRSPLLLVVALVLLVAVAAAAGRVAGRRR